MARQNLPTHGSFAHLGEAAAASHLLIKFNNIKTLHQNRDMA
jgi:hypothetical protein